MADYSAKNVSKNILWKLIERVTSLIVSLGTTTLLARILEPTEFGKVAMINVFVAVLQVFVTSGLSNALLQKKDADYVDFSTMFWINLAISLVLYVALIVGAPFIADFYNYPELKNLLSVLGIQIVIIAINSIQSAYIAKNMLFKFYFTSTLSAKILSGCIGVVLALTGFGAWAIVWQTICLYLIETIILWVRVRWRPQFIFQIERAKNLYSYSWKIMISSLIASLRDKIRGLFIGKKFSSDSLAFFEKGILFPDTIVTNCGSSLAAVIFPVASNVQESSEKIKQLCSKWVSLFGFVTLPTLTYLGVTAKSFICFLLTDKWLPAVLFLRVACVYYAVDIIERPIRELTKAVGKSDICLKMQIEKTAVTLVTCVITANISIQAVGYGLVACALINVLISMYYATKVLGYRFIDLIKDIQHSVQLSFITGLLVYLFSFFMEASALLLFLQTLVGMLLFIALAVVTKNREFLAISTMLKSILKR